MEMWVNSPYGIEYLLENCPKPYFYLYWAQSLGIEKKIILKAQSKIELLRESSSLSSEAKKAIEVADRYIESGDSKEMESLFKELYDAAWFSATVSERSDSKYSAAYMMSMQATPREACYGAYRLFWRFWNTDKISKIKEMNEICKEILAKEILALC